MRKLDTQIRELESEKSVYAEFLQEGEISECEYNEIISSIDAQLNDLRAEKAGVIFTTLLAALPAMLSADRDDNDPMNAWIAAGNPSIEPGCSPKAITGGDNK